jgi:hypothetical protein
MLYPTTKYGTSVFPIGIKLPSNTANLFIGRETLKTIQDNKLFASLS